MQVWVYTLRACVKHVEGIGRLTPRHLGNRQEPREDARIDRPVSPYAATKAACELYCHNYYHLYGISVTALRFFTVYGPSFTLP